MSLGRNLTGLAIGVFNRTGRSSPNYDPKLVQILVSLDIATRWTALVCIIFGIFVNLIVIVISLKFSKLPTHRLLILHLAIADMIYLLIYSFWVHRRFRKQEWIFGDFLCKCTILWPAALTCSMFTITFIAVERYRTLMNPFVPKLSRKSCVFCLLLLWLISIGPNLPYAVHKGTVNNIHKVECKMQWPVAKQDVRKYLNLSIFILTYPIPMAILIFCYLRIGVKVYIKGKSESANDSHEQAAVHRTVSVQQKKKKNRKLLIRLLGVLAVFLITTTPNQAMILWMDHAPKQRTVDSLRKTFIVLHFLSALVHFHPCLNPLIYCISDPRYRIKFKEILKGIKDFVLERVGVLRCCHTCPERQRDEEGKTSLSLLVRHKQEDNT